MAKTKTKAKRVKTTGTTYVSVILDASGSMDYYENSVREYFTQLIEDVKINARKNNQEVYVSVYFFNNHVNRVASIVTPDQALKSISSYRTFGSTALFDAIEQAINDVELLASKKENAVLIQVVTDGENNVNDSKGSQLKQMLLKDNYTVAIQTPESGRKTLIGLGIPSDNIRIWDISDKAGLGKNSQTVFANTVGLGNYFQARGVGTRSLKSFYADVDLHDLKPTELKKKLDDVTTLFKEYKVEKECNVTEFYEEKTKRIYSKGDVYYLLTKKETVQAKKDIVLNKKGEKTIYGGETVRDIIGIPKGQDGTVSPLNLSYYNVYIESTSDNRKLVRGSTALIRR